MKDMLVAVTAVGLIGFAQAGEPSFYRQCEDLIAPPDAPGDQSTHQLVRACVNYYKYGLQRGWLPKQILESKSIALTPPVQSGQGGDGGAGGSVPELVGGGNVPIPHDDDYYGYKYCEELIGPPHDSRDDYTYGLMDDCVSYYRYSLRHGWPSYAMGYPPPESGQPGEPGRSGHGGAGGAGGSADGLSGGAGGEGGSAHSSHRSSRRGQDGADGESYGTGEGGEGGSAGRGLGSGSGGDGGAGSSGGVGGAGGAGGDTR